MMTTMATSDWQGYTHGYENTDPYPYPQGVCTPVPKGMGIRHRYRVQDPCGFTPGVSYVIGKFHVPSTIDNYAHKKYYYSNLSIHCLCLITDSLLNDIILDQTKFAPLHYHYNDRGYLSMLFSCFRVLLKVIATNQRNSKMILSKHVVKICMSYD